MASSAIEWTEMTWNPSTGCNKLSAGCKFCYAETMTKRLKAMGIQKYSDGFKVKVHPDELLKPFTWKKPKIVFVNSMSDMFHEEIPIEFIKEVFNVMNQNLHHTFQVLTKRPERALEFNSELDWTPNIWLGTSVENQEVTGRVEFLEKTGAAVKFLSIEPLIGPITKIDIKNINWVIVGGESGAKARPIMAEWIKPIRDNCKKKGVPFFFKQWGKPKFNPNPNDPTMSQSHPDHAKGGCLLDGKLYREMPTLTATTI